jgi:SAM-dependent methyltransferase
MTSSYVKWKDWQAGNFGRYGLEDALYYARELKASGVPSVSGLRIGELGYGNGGFAGWVQRAGGYWLGKEALPELQKRAVEAGFDVVAPEVDFATVSGSANLDLMVAFDVIEHMELDAIRSFLRETREALKTGGLLLLRSPSGDSPFSGAMHYGDLTHRTILGSSAVRQLAMESGLEVCQVRPPVFPLWGVGPVRAARRIAARLAQTLAFSLVRRVLMGHASAVVSPNMIVVLRKEGLPP